MDASLGRVISDYRALVEVCRRRAEELALSRSEIDRISGLPHGYAGKLLSNGFAKKPKRMWPVSLESMLGTLGLKILLIEDEAATRRTLALREPVNCNQQRFGNTCRSSVKIESIKSAEVAAPRENKPPPASRAHLRVVQSRRGGKYGRLMSDGKIPPHPGSGARINRDEAEVRSLSAPPRR
jgi:hypothetical protein